MRKFLLWFLLSIPLLSFAQFSVSFDTKDETCSGNGGVVVKIDNAIPGNTYDVTMQLSGSNDSTNQRTAAVEDELEITFANMVAGTWNVIVAELSPQNVQSRVVRENVVINKNIIDPAFTARVVQECNTSNIAINLVRGEFTSYILYHLDNGVQGTEVARITSADDTFTNVPDGTYRIVARYECGQDKTQDVTVTNRVMNYSFVKGRPSGNQGDVYDSRGYNVLGECDVVYHNVEIREQNGQIPENRFPITFTYEVLNDSNVVVATSTVVMNSPEDNNTRTGNTIVHLPYMDGKIRATLTDACGTTHTEEDTMRKYKKMFLEDSQGNWQATCGKRYITAHFIGYAPNITVTIEEAPSEFVPGNYGFDSNRQKTYTSFEGLEGAIFIGDQNNTLPKGTYKIKFRDNCTNEEVTETVEVRQLLGYNVRTLKQLCDPRDGHVSARIFIGSGVSEGGNIFSAMTSAEFTDGPAEFVAEYGTFPFNLSDYIRSSNRAGTNGVIFFESIPVGTYKIKSQNSCGLTEEREIIVRDAPDNYSHKMKITQQCSAFNFEATVKVDAFYDHKTAFQRYNADTDTWEEVVGATFVSQQAGERTLRRNNISKVGKYRLVLITNYFSVTGSVGEGLKECVVVLEEYDYSGSKTEIKDRYINSCNNNKYELIVVADGPAPLKYEILSKDNDTSFARPQQDSPIFSDLDPGVYTTKITDSCGNTIVQRIEVRDPRAPRVVVDNICEDEESSLTVLNLTTYEVEWYKDGVKLESQGNIELDGNTLRFKSYKKANDTGVYTAKLLYPTQLTCGRSIESSIELTDTNDTNPSSGTAQQDIVIDNRAYTYKSIDLFDYLEGDYDDFGTWEETSTIKSNLLQDSIWDAEYAVSGDYEFTYTVNGTCTGTSKTVVKIKYIAPCNLPYNPLPSESTTPIGISNLDVHNVDGWPQSVPSGYIVLESNTKGFTITRIQDPETAIQNPVEGMLVFDTDEDTEDGQGVGCFKLYNGTRWKCVKPACLQ